MSREELLFMDGDLDATLEGWRQKMKNRVDEISRDQFLNTSTDTLVQHLVDTFSVVPLSIDRAGMTMEEEEARVDVSHDRMRVGRWDGGPVVVPGVRVTVHLPYNGDSILWKVKPNQYTLSPPRARVVSHRENRGGRLEFMFSLPHDRPHDAIKSTLDSQLSEIERFLTWQAPQVSAANAQLPGLASTWVAARKERLGKQSGLSSALGIPLKRKPGAPDTKPIRLERRSVTLPPAPAGYQPEPGIADGEYERILNILHHVAATFEAAPTSFVSLGEEHLRNLLLASLNAQYEGGATGETFRKLGKTDIRIEDGERSAFVAECKLWDGAATATSALEQLLGYLTWRDCKAALLFFNKKNAQFGALLEKLPLALRAHRALVREHATKSANEWRFRFRSLEDETREVLVHVQLFNLYTAPETAAPESSPEKRNRRAPRVADSKS